MAFYERSNHPADRAQERAELDRRKRVRANSDAASNSGRAYELRPQMTGYIERVTGNEQALIVWDKILGRYVGRAPEVTQRSNSTNHSQIVRGQAGNRQGGGNF
jgi:hypothetical protein